MAKRTQLASLAISRGGGKTIFATGGTSGAQKYSPEEKEKEKEGRGQTRLSGRKRKGKRRGEVKQEQVERDEIERPAEEEEGKKKRGRETERQRKRQINTIINNNHDYVQQQQLHHADLRGGRDQSRQHGAPVELHPKRLRRRRRNLVI